MRDKHLHIAADSELLKLIYETVSQRLTIDKKKTARKILAKFLVYCLLFTLSYSALYIVSDPLVFVGCFMMYGFVALLFAFNFAHDFSHHTVFRNKRLDNICFVLMYTMQGAHAEAWKQRHINSHHYAPNVEDYDSDLKITKLIRVIPGSRYHWYHRFQHLYAPLAYTTYSLFWIFIKDFVIFFSKDEKAKQRGVTYQLSFWLQKIVYVALILILPMQFSDQRWYIVAIGFLCMHLSQSLFLLFTFFMTHHVETTAYPTTNEAGYINTSWIMNQIQSSNDMHPFSETANFILGGFNNHIAHHLFPHYHHIHYPRLNKILYPLLTEHGFPPNQTTYCGGIRSHLRLLKRMSSINR